jgi:hypothetical protein
MHRRIHEDDGYGVGEPLNEPGVDGRGLVITARSFLSVQPANDSGAIQKLPTLKLFTAGVNRPLMQRMFHQPMSLFQPILNAESIDWSTFEWTDEGLDEWVDE